MSRLPNVVDAFTASNDTAVSLCTSAPEIGTDSEYNVLLSIFLKTGLGCMGEESSGGPGVEFEKNNRIGR